MKALINSFLALFLVYSPLIAADFPELQTLSARDIAPAAVEYQVPAPLPPDKAVPDGVPAVLFTEETSIVPVLSKAINDTREFLDIALYNLQLGDLSKAIVAAKDRKVRVRVVVDYGHVFPKAGNEIKYLIDNGIDFRVLKGRGTMGSMHNKYAIFDRKLLQMGSANWSNSAQNTNFENMMFFMDPDMISGYQDNFEWVWKQAKILDAPDAQGPPPGKIPADPNPSVAFNGLVFPKYMFSPRGGIDTQIVKTIDSAKETIDIAMFAFTSNSAIKAVFEARKRGVRVRIMHNAGSDFPFADQVRANGIDLRFLTGRTIKGLLHDKFEVIDGTLLITGSYNWSNNAENSNFENIVFTTEKIYLDAFKAEFNKLYGQATVTWPIIPK